MINVSTKTGDKGVSGLANGVRLPKDDIVFEVLGTLDELNSWMGLCITKLSDQFVTDKKILHTIQDTLFHVGAELAYSHKTKLNTTQLQFLEKHSEKLQASMEDEWYAKFLLPGGTVAAAHLDVTRTICRRLERRIVTLSKTNEVSPLISSYINRLSDYLYVLRCKVNHEEKYQEFPFEV